MILTMASYGKLDYFSTSIIVIYIELFDVNNNF